MSLRHAITGTAVHSSPRVAHISSGSDGTGTGSSRHVDAGMKLSQMAPTVVDIYSVISMVFGGCCMNVWAYEQLLSMNPGIGSALTFSQMLFITVQSLPGFLSFSSGFPRLKPRQVPVKQWGLQVLVLTTGSLLNNWAFAYKVPLTVQIIFRSAGLAVSMLFGYIFLKKRYTFIQLESVAIVTVGVILATLSRPSNSTSSTLTPLQTSEDLRKYIIGIIMLFLSLFCTGLLGLLQERTYKQYGPCWKEGIFYTHSLSLPVFIFLRSDIKRGISSLSNPSSTSSTTAYLVMFANLVSQLICVSGVNRLSSQVSSVSTNIALTARKALSLCFSVWWFGNSWNAQLGTGAAMVFVGSLLYTTGGKNEEKRE